MLTKTLFTLLLLAAHGPLYCWGFYAHRKINQVAVFLLPPGMMILYKPYIDFLEEHAVDPDKRRYVVAAEASRHYIDMDHYGRYPFPELPRAWKDAMQKFGEDSLVAHGIVPWWINIMQERLTKAFRDKDQTRILKFSAEIGHYIADAHVPLHTSSNHNGQLSGQLGIHAFWESRIPEMLAEKNYDFIIGKAQYLDHPMNFIWDRVLESAAAADTVLSIEKQLSSKFRPDQKFSFENRNGAVVRQYAAAYTLAYNRKLKGMVERRMRQAIFAIASFWYTAWTNAGQPDLSTLQNRNFSEQELKEFDRLNTAWAKANSSQNSAGDH
jgi:hypothetical protein